MASWDYIEHLSKIAHLTGAKEVGSNQYEGNCPLHCKSKSIKKTFYFKIENEKILVICHRCGDRPGLVSWCKDHDIWLSPPRNEKQDWAEEAWQKALSLDHPDAEPARLYFERRHISVAPTSEIRLHPSLLLKGMGHHPCIIFALRDHNGTFTGIQRIYIQKDGSKYGKDSKKCLGVKTNIQFDDVGDTLAIAEGPETALAVRCATGLRTWSTVDAGGMEKFRAPYGVKKLFIFADLDHSKTGEKAAHQCARINSEIDVHVVIPEADPGVFTGIDFNDVLISKGPEAIKTRMVEAAQVIVKPLYEKEGYVFEPLSEIQKAKFGDWDWMIEDMLTSDGFGLFVGKPKCGKSTLVRQLMVATDEGGHWLGRKVKKTNVLYIAYEETKKKIQEHFAQMTDVEMNHVYIHVGLAKKVELSTFGELVDKLKIGLLVIDPLVGLLNVQDMNKYEEVYKVLSPIVDFCRSKKVAVIGLHHTKKGRDEDPDAILGSTALRGAVDMTLLMQRNEKDERIIQTEQRVGMSLEKTMLNYDMDTEMLSIGDAQWVHMDNEARKFLDTFLNDGPMSQKEILEKMPGDQNKKIGILKRLEKKKLIQKSGKGGRFDPFKWSLCRLGIDFKNLQ